MSEQSLMKIQQLLLSLSFGIGLMISNIATSQIQISLDVSDKKPIQMQEYLMDNLSNAKSIDIMTYQMPNVQGKEVDATALVLFPKTEKPVDGWKIVAWAHGTVGVSNSCAPSLDVLNNGFRVFANSLLKAGYIIVAPDYEGLGTIGVHPYLNLESEAISVIYAVKSLQNQNSAKFHGDWMVAGQSQGGQAALGTAEYANHDPMFKGAVAGAPASHLDLIIEEIAPVALSQLEERENEYSVELSERNSIFSYATLLSYGAFIGMGIRAEFPDFDYLSLFTEPAKNIAKKVEGTTSTKGLCLNGLRTLFQEDIIKFLVSNPDKRLIDYPGLNLEAFEENIVLQQFFVDNQPGTKRIDKPILVIQGEMDTNVPAVVTEKVVDGLKKLGSKNIELILVPDASHREAIVWRNDELVGFIEKYMPAR